MFQRSQGKNWSEENEGWKNLTSPRALVIIIGMIRHNTYNPNGRNGFWQRQSDTTTARSVDLFIVSFDYCNFNNTTSTYGRNLI